MVKKGYKQTEIGVIPEDWEVKPLKVVAPLQRGFDLPYSSIKDGIYPVVFSNGIGAHHSSYMVKGPGVVMGRSGTIGKIHYVKSDYWPHNTTLWVTDFHNNDPLFASYLFKTIPWNLYNSGSGVPTLNRNDVQDYLVAIPSPKEQTEIAAILSDVDTLINSLKRQIVKKKAIKQGAMQELLTGKRRLPGFAGEWEKTVLGTVSSFYTGGTPSKKREDWWNGDIPWISSSDLTEDAITSVNINRYISKDAVEHSATRICPKDAVLVVSRVGVGKVAVAPCELCTSQDFTTIVPHRHNPHFLAYMLIPVMKELAMQAQGTSIKGVTVEDIQKIIMPTPTIDEQNQTVDILANMDSEIEALEQKLEKYSQVKQGMMQQLLTGKIRLV